MGDALITVTLSVTDEEAVVVDYATADGSATAGSDYVAASGTLTFTSGGEVLTFTVPITDDGLYEGDETVTLTLSQPDGGALGENNPATLAILNDDDEPVAGLSAANDSPTGLGVATHVTATVTAGSNVVYNWAFGDGSTGSGATAAHTYAQAGIYSAVVTASNSANALTATTRITVSEAISGLVAVNDGPTELGEATHLTATITAGGQVAYAWDLGDESTASGAAVTHTYTALGSYTAIVTASNGVSQMAVTTTVVITDVPIEGLTAGNDGPTELRSATHLMLTLREHGRPRSKRGLTSLINGIWGTASGGAGPH